MAVAFENIFMADIETKMISQSKTKPIEWKRFIDDIFSLWDSGKKEINLFIEQTNNFHPTIKFTAEISDNETTFLDTIIFKGERFRNESILDICTHYKPTESFQYTHFTSSHPVGVKRGFIKGEALRLPRTNSSETTFDESISNFKSRLITRRYVPLRDDTDNVIRSQLRTKTVGSTTKEKNSQTNLAFCHNIPPIGA